MIGKTSIAFIGLALLLIVVGTESANAKGEKKAAPCMWELHPVATEKLRLALMAEDEKAILEHLSAAGTGCFKKGTVIKINFGRLLESLEETKPAQPEED